MMVSPALMENSAAYESAVLKISSLDPVGVPVSNRYACAWPAAKKLTNATVATSADDLIFVSIHCRGAR